MADPTKVADPANAKPEEIKETHIQTASEIQHDEDALKPDPGQGHLFTVENNRFAFSPGQFGKLLNPKSLSAFYALGGIDGIERGLRTNRVTGLSVDEAALDGTVTFQTATGTHEPSLAKEDSNADAPSKLPRASTSAIPAGSPFCDRRRIYGDNRLPEKKSKSLLELAWITYNDKVLILLTIAALISLALGLYQTFGIKHEPGEAKVEWVEGVAIIAAIVIVVVVGTVNDWQKERQFMRLSKKKDDRVVKVIRSGKQTQISVYDILVGDVIQLEPGDMVPVDGIFISGHNVKCDESAATGESDLLKKLSADEVFKAIKSGAEDVHKLDPFILSGSKVAEGTGTFVVTSVGVNSVFGRIMMSLRVETDATPLQAKLNILAEQIAKLGGAAALVLFVVLFIKFLIQLKGNKETPAQKGQDFLRIFIVAVTVVVVAVPEGLPLAVTLALAFATTRMLKDNNLVRVLRACETMGNATTVCSDKTGTLTENKMTLVAATIGSNTQFGESSDEPKPPVVEEKPKEAAANGKTEATAVPEVAHGASAGAAFVSKLSGEVKTALIQSIVLNSTAFEDEVEGKAIFVGSKTETALLEFAKNNLGIGPVAEERANGNIAHVFPFNSAIKYMGTVVKLADGTYRLYAKGASEILLAQCTRIVTDPSSSLSTTAISTEEVEHLKGLISDYAGRSLRTIALLYRDFSSWPPADAVDSSGQPDMKALLNDMTFLGVVGIKDPLRAGVREAVADCQRAGVTVRMVTGDNMLTARAIASECGIYNPEAGGLILDGPVFRRMEEAEMLAKIPHLQVLARSSPEDKEILVRNLKMLGETVAVTGDGTNDGPALKGADVGFSMGITGTEVAKEASDIILMDDNFASIVKAMMWGRAVNDSVKKFLQFQLTVNITAVILTFVSAVASAKEESVLNAVQLLWVNLIMDTLAALALATDPPTRKVLDRHPDRKSAPLITITMWKMILGQAIFQLVVTLILNFAGISILKLDRHNEDDQMILKTVVFNTFVWMQIFNQYNNRRLDNNLNIFEGIHRNLFFIIINIIMVGGQVMIIYVGGEAFKVSRLKANHWGICLVLGFLSCPVAVLLRFIPDTWVSKLFPRRYRRKLMPEDAGLSYEDDHDLPFIRTVRGGRLNSMKLKFDHLKEKAHEKHNTHYYSTHFKAAMENMGHHHHNHY